MAFMRNKVNVFVYGTLMRNRWNHYYLKEQNFIGTGKLEGYEMYNVRSFPGIVQKPDEYVIGEVYQVTEQVLKRLDQLESEGYMYKRQSERIKLEGSEMEACVYVWLGDIKGCERVMPGEMPWSPMKVTEYK